MFKGIIREFKKEDQKAISNIYALYWNGEDFLNRLSQRLQEAVDSAPENFKQRFKYFVAEDEGEVVGILGLRKAPLRMVEFTKTKNPAEFYIMAVKNKGKGVGKALIAKGMQSSKETGYTETVFFSGEKHKDSWGFYDHLGFERVSSATAPNGEQGQVWRLVTRKDGPCEGRT